MDDSKQTDQNQSDISENPSLNEPKVADFSTKEPTNPDVEPISSETTDHTDPETTETAETTPPIETDESNEPEKTAEPEGTEETRSEQTEPAKEEVAEVETEPEAEKATETSEPNAASTTDGATPASDDTPAQSTSPLKPNTDVPGARWYVVHTYSGHENKVALTLKQRIESEHLEKKILDVLVPMQEKIEIKSGKKVNVKEKVFPGYILVKMVLDDISWLAVRTTQGVTSFVGMGNKPTPISDAEVATIVTFTQSEAPMYKQVFMANDTVKIVDGPFADFIGKIDSVDEEKGKVRVLVSIFGRETPVELDFLQIKKI